MSAPRFRPVAIVGVGCVLPRANDVESFWTQVMTGASALGPLDAREFRPEWYFAADRSAPDRTHSLHGALVEEPRLDAKKYRIPPKVLWDMHRMQLAFIEATAQALDDARGGLGAVAPERIGLVLGSLGGGLRPGSRVQARLVDMLRSLSASTTLNAHHPGLASELAEVLTQQLDAELAGTSETEATASFSSIWAGRAAKLFDLRGPHFAVDAGYASTLAALQSASQQLNAGDCDAVVVAGCSQLLTPHDLVAFSKLGGLGTTVLAPFDRRSSGTLLGEGVGVFVLRRLDDAVSAEAKVHAVIRGIGAASEGQGPSLVVPDSKGQVLAMRRAYAQAGYGPRDVQYVECHAAGIPSEDATEFRSLSALWRDEAGTAPVMLGGVKELTGHLQAASGAAGLLKATLALSRRVLPPQRSFQEGAEGVSLEGTPFYFAKQGSPWPAVADGLRRASVSAFGFGGLCFHLTLEEFSANVHSRLARTLPPPRPSEPVAIVGLGGVFPGAANVEQLWSNLLAKHCAIGAMPPERAETARYLDPTRKSKARPYTNLVGTIVDGSWPQGQVRVSDEVSSQIDRGQSWTMRAALQALQDSGTVDAKRVGLAMGYMPPLEREFQAQARVYYAEFDGRLAEHLRQRGVDDATAALIRGEVERDYKKDLPPITEQTLPGYLGSLAVGRVAHHLDFQGPAMMVESACASSLAAVELGAQWLSTGECDLVLAGGMYASLGVDGLVQWCSFGGLSQSGSFPFDARADGYVTSEGAAMLALKRLSDAEAAGDRVYAVIRAVAGATDPKSASIWAPSSEGQVQAVRRAVEKAGVSPDGLQYLEGHGTGTPVGDPVEVETYRAVYGQGRVGKQVLLGSIKSNLGHLNSGAGAVSLLKVALALHRGQVPPNVGFATPNPAIPWRELPFRVPTDLEPWAASEEGPRRAGVTSLGLGGTSYHAVVEEFSPQRRRDGLIARRVSWVFPHRGARSEAMLRELSARFACVKETLTEVGAAFESLTGQPLHAASRAEDAFVADVAEVLTGVAYFRLLRSYGLRVDVLLGEGTGEYSALVASGMLGVKDALSALHLRARLGGSAHAVEGLPRLRAELSRFTWRAPEVAVLSAIHGRYYEAPLPEAFLARHLALLDTQPSRLGPHVRLLHDDGVRVFLEAGTGETLGACLQTLPDVVRLEHPTPAGEVARFHRLLAFSDVHRLLNESVR
ncbi:Ketoacyl-synthetase C-terminal extension [Myxococcus fulvus]|uniref:Ketoacyl-synthetase C-terminal extension n=1 Tax=Myxococcus fulvus TaxID=33 RepID=A0A511TD03_MYXFU|nr:type I polyketide synthase [Myxococcus fulvus]GEN12056.1 polyketide synthase [Myxococcus fulvus]SEU36703.1 Ketoacyl-synthetase C-terminal extension [Myxococcus fulvus]